MSNLPAYKVWDGNRLFDVAEITRVDGGIRWYGPGYGQGWLFLNPLFNWNQESIPVCDLLLEVVTSFDY